MNRKTGRLAIERILEFKHELKRPAVAQFPKVWLIAYSLACYCAQKGRLDECEEWFKNSNNWRPLRQGAEPDR